MAPFATVTTGVMQWQSTYATYGRDLRNVMIVEGEHTDALQLHLSLMGWHRWRKRYTGSALLQLQSCRDYI